jgi:ubiquinone/menaquinone biosynthesis C-methylase UbiE
VDHTEKKAITDRYVHLLSVSDPLRESVIRRAIQALQLPQGSRGLDAGCGIGLQALLLVEAVGSQGHVTGLDVSPEFLALPDYYAFFTYSLFCGRVAR